MTNTQTWIVVISFVILVGAFIYHILESTRYNEDESADRMLTKNTLDILLIKNQENSNLLSETIKEDDVSKENQVFFKKFIQDLHDDLEQKIDALDKKVDNLNITDK